MGVFLECWICHVTASSGTSLSMTSWRERYSTVQAGVYNSIHYQEQFFCIFLLGGGGTVG